MDQVMLQQLHETKEEGTIYFSHRLKKADRLDSLIYRLIALVIIENDEIKKHNKGTQYFYLLRSWLFSLQAMHANEKSEDNDSITATFMENLEKLTPALTKEEVSEMLYRLPWHLRTILLTSNESQLDIISIAAIADYKSLEQFKNNGTMYFAFGGFDFTAIKAIHSDITDGNEVLLADELMKNMPAFGGGVTILNKHLNGETASYETKDEHAFAGIAMLANEFLKSSKTKDIDDLFGHLLMTLSCICFWHLELTQVEHNWVIKTGKFKFLKKHSFKKLFTKNH
jgi:hypothetical protein